MTSLVTGRGADEVRVVSLDEVADPVAMHIFQNRAMRPRVPALVFFHGGLFNAGQTVASYPFARALSARISVVLVEWPLAPGACFPKTPEIALRSAIWVCANANLFGARSGAVVIGGEEAGGNLAAASTMMLRDCRESCSPSVKLLGQALISPMLDPTQSTHSMRGCKDFTCSKAWSEYLPDAADAVHPYAAPLHSRRLSGLPPTLIISADQSPLRDDAELYAGNLQRAGIAVTARRLPGAMRSLTSPDLDTFAAVVDSVAEFVLQSV
jgi:acetyl esterase/lipase